MLMEGCWPVFLQRKLASSRALERFRNQVFPLFPNLHLHAAKCVLELPAPAPWSASAIKCVVHAQMRCRIVGRDFRACCHECIRRSHAPVAFPPAHTAFATPQLVLDGRFANRVQYLQVANTQNDERLISCRRAPGVQAVAAVQVLRFSRTHVSSENCCSLPHSWRSSSGCSPRTGTWWPSTRTGMRSPSSAPAASSCASPSPSSAPRCFILTSK